MTLRVSNGIQNVTRTVTVMPVPAQPGNFSISLRQDVNPNPNPATLTINNPATFKFQLQLQSGMSQPTTLNLIANISNATLANQAVPIPAGLVQSIQFQDDVNNNAPITSITLAPNDVHNVTVFIPSIPAALDKATFTLLITASAPAAPNVSISPYSSSITVGTAVPQMDPNVTATPSGTSVRDQNDQPPSPAGSGGAYDPTTNTITLKAGFQIHLDYMIALKGTALYSLSLQANASTTGWIPAPPSPIHPVSVASLQAPTTANAPVTVTLSPSPGASSTGVVTFLIKDPNSALQWSKDFNVQLLQ
jgi:hypothetical protein